MPGSQKTMRKGKIWEHIQEHVKVLSWYNDKLQDLLLWRQVETVSQCVLVCIYLLIGKE